VTGRPGDPFGIAAGRTPGSWVTPFGTLGLDQAHSQVVLSDVIPASGVFVTRIEAGSVQPGTWLAQGAVGGSVAAITDLETLELH